MENAQYWFQEGASSGYQIERSLRFNSAASAYLSRTPVSAGNRKTWTFSCWFKLGNHSSSGTYNLLGARGSNNATYFVIQIRSEALAIAAYLGSYFTLVSAQVFRDPSAWYHLVVTLDTTQATAENRAKAYINGTQITQWSTANYGTENDDLGINQAGEHFIGARAVSSNAATFFWDGYMSETHLIDGQALAPSSFGEISPATGVWQPKRYSGTYGTNGFYLNFKDNSSVSALGKDSSGNGNDWTPNNFSVTAGAGNDSMSDTPTYNCTTLSTAYPSAWAQNIHQSGRMQYASASTGGYLATLSSQVDPRQDFYFEFQAYTNGSYPGNGGCPCAIAFTEGDLAHLYPSQSSTWSFLSEHFTKTLPTLGFLWFSHYSTTGQNQAFYQNGSGTSPGTALTPISGSCKSSGTYQAGGNYSGLALTGIYYNASAKTITLYGSNEDGTGAQSAVYSIANWSTDFSKPWAIHAQTQFQSGFFGGGYVRLFLSPSEWRIATRPSGVAAPGAAQAQRGLALPATITGSFSGNGSADGPFIYTGCLPGRIQYGTVDCTYGNRFASNDVDFLANGFKVRSTVSNSGSVNYTVTTTHTDGEYSGRAIPFYSSATAATN